MPSFGHLGAHRSPSSCLDVPGQAEFQLGFGFPSLIPGCSGNGALLLPGSPSLLQPLPPSFACLPLARSSSSPRQPPGFLAWLPPRWDRALWSLEEGILDHPAASLGPSCLHCPMPGDSSKRTLEEARVCCPEGRGCEPPPPRPRHPQLRHVVVAGAQAAFELHSPKEPKLQRSPSPRWLLCHLEEAVVGDALRSLLGCFCPAGLSPQQVCLGSPVRGRFLGTRGCSCLAGEGLTRLFSLLDPFSCLSAQVWAGTEGCWVPTSQPPPPSWVPGAAGRP